VDWTTTRTFLESELDDLHHAARSFRRSPLFTAVIIATLAIGIGATTAVFSVVDRLLFRSLPYGNPDSLVSFGITGPMDENEFMFGGTYVSWSPHLSQFDSETSLSPWVEGDLGDQNPVRVRCIPVEANFLSTFGLRVAAGRDFTRQDDQPHAPRVALISYGLWKSRFAANRAMLDHAVTLDDQPTRIIGVLPEEFELPTLGRADVLIPQQLDAIAQSRGAMQFLRTFARLKPGVSLAQARQQIRPLFQTTLQTEVPPPLRPEVHLAVRSLRDRQVADVRLASWLLFAAVLALLLIACANAANLLLARSAAHQREWAMRAALGASRGRLIRQALTESLVLAFTGAIAGCLLALLLVRALLALAPEGLLHLRQATIDGRVLAFALLISVVSALLFGLAPALQSPRSEALTGWRSISGERRLLRHLLVAVQIAVSLVLLTAASLFIRSFLTLQQQQLGLQPATTITASFELSHNTYQTPERLTSFYNQLEAKFATIPGVTALALSDSVPPGGWIHSRPFSNLAVLGKPPLATAGGAVFFRYVSANYFRILRIPILAGRSLNDADRTKSQNSIVLSRSLARRIFGTQNPLGQQIIVDPQAPPLTVVGIAADVKNNGVENSPEPEYYKARKRTPDSGLGLGSHGVALLQSTVSTPALASSIRAEIASLDPRLAVTVETLRQCIDQQADQPRFLTVLIGLFAGLGLVLAAIGLYSVMAFLVNRQTREIGVRMAVGATPGNIAGLILKHAAAWTASGMAVGLCASLALTRLARSLLFQVSPNDPLSPLVAAAVLASAAFLAALWPSLRASRIDPAVLLRTE